MAIADPSGRRPFAASRRRGWGEGHAPVVAVLRASARTHRRQTSPSRPPKDTDPGPAGCFPCKTPVFRDRQKGHDRLLGHRASRCGAGGRGHAPVVAVLPVFADEHLGRRVYRGPQRARTPDPCGFPPQNSPFLGSAGRDHHRLLGPRASHCGAGGRGPCPRCGSTCCVCKRAPSPRLCAVQGAGQRWARRARLVMSRRRNVSRL